MTFNNNSDLLSADITANGNWQFNGQFDVTASTGDINIVATAGSVFITADAAGENLTFAAKNGMVFTTNVADIALGSAASIGLASVVDIGLTSGRDINLIATRNLNIQAIFPAGTTSNVLYWDPITHAVTQDAAGSAGPAWQLSGNAGSALVLGTTSNNSWQLISNDLVAATVNTDQSVTFANNVTVTDTLTVGTGTISTVSGSMQVFGPSAGLFLGTNSLTGIHIDGSQNVFISESLFVLNVKFSGGFSNYTTVAAQQNISGSGNYLLPLNPPSVNGQLLSCTTAGTMSWSSVSPNAWELTGNTGYNPLTSFIGSTTALGFEIRTDNAAAVIFNGTTQVATFSEAPVVPALNFKNGANTILFQTGSGYVNQTYTLPLGLPALAGYVLSSDLSGNLSWVAQSGGGGWSTSGNSISGGLLGTTSNNSWTLIANNNPVGVFAASGQITLGNSSTGYLQIIPSTSITLDVLSIDIGLVLATSITMGNSNSPVEIGCKNFTVNANSGLIEFNTSNNVTFNAAGVVNIDTSSCNISNNFSLSGIPNTVTSMVLYYDSSSKTVSYGAVGAAAASWLLAGNAAVPGGSYLGTSDSNPLLLKTNNVTVLDIDASQNVTLTAVQLELNSAAFDLTASSNILHSTIRGSSSSGSQLNIINWDVISIIAESTPASSLSIASRDIDIHAVGTGGGAGFTIESDSTFSLNSPTLAIGTGGATTSISFGNSAASLAIVGAIASGTTANILYYDSTSHAITQGAAGSIGSGWTIDATNSGAGLLFGTNTANGWTYEVNSTSIGTVSSSGATIWTGPIQFNGTFVVNSGNAVNIIAGDDIAITATGSHMITLTATSSTTLDTPILELSSIPNASAANVLFYDSTTKQVSYDTAPGGGGSWLTAGTNSGAGLLFGTNTANGWSMVVNGSSFCTIDNNGNADFFCPSFIAVNALSTAAMDALTVNLGTVTSNTVNIGRSASTVQINGTVELNNLTNVTTSDVVYYNTTSKAITYGTIGASSGWSLSGNGGTSPPTQFLGTTDFTELYIKTNNATAIQIGNDQSIFLPGVSSSTPVAGAVTNRPPSGYATVCINTTSGELAYYSTF